MASIINLDLSRPGIGRGDALGWHLDDISSAESYVEFGPSGASSALEGFEAGWGNDPAPQDLVFATFESAGGELGVVEGFEGGWKNNDQRTDDIDRLPGAFAQFDGQPVEGFETGWKGNENAQHPPAAAPLLIFNPGPWQSDTESFDVGWDGVEGIIEVPLLNFDITTTVNFVEAGANDEIVRLSGDWIADGVRAGSGLVVSGAGANNGTYTVFSVTQTTIKLTSDTDVSALLGVSKRFRNFVFESFDGMPTETFEFAWADIAEDF